MVAAPVSPEERLRAIERDPNLMHTGARWRAHAAVHPRAASKARELELARVGRDAVEVGELRAALEEFREKLPDDDEATAYLAWLLAELESDPRAPELLAGLPEGRAR